MTTEELTVVTSTSKRARDRLARLFSHASVAVPLPPPPTADETSDTFGMLNEMAKLVDLLRERSLLTLVGEVGAGKSVLARSVARAQKHRYPGGTLFCDVSHVATLRELLESVAATLSMGPIPDSTADAISAVETALACREKTLLVIDGFDELALLAGDTLERWLLGARNLTCLVTAREPVCLHGEYVFRVEKTRGLPKASRRGAA